MGSTGSRGRSFLLQKSSIKKSLRRLDSSHRLSVTCSGSDLSQLYLSSPELDAAQVLSNNNIDGDHHRPLRRQKSWLDAADLYGRRKSFLSRKKSFVNHYAQFLDDDMMSDIAESDEERMLLIEETYKGATDEHTSNNGKVTTCFKRCLRKLQSPSIVVPIMMIVDLILGVGLSLYDSNLLRNVPGFNFPLCYAFTQKLTNALASLVLIILSRRREREEREKFLARQRAKLATGTIQHDQFTLTALPSIQTFRRHIVPLSAVALVQTISAALANRALQIVPLPLFKVCLMCGPIFVAFLTKIVDGQLYSKGRLMALGLIGAGAVRAVYAEADGADNPRYIMEGAGFALGASAFGGIGLVLSSVLMHRGGGNDDDEEDGDEEHENLLGDGNDAEQDELNPLSLLFYLSCEGFDVERLPNPLGHIRTRGRGSERRNGRVYRVCGVFRERSIENDLLSNDWVHDVVSPICADICVG